MVMQISDALSTISDEEFPPNKWRHKAAASMPGERNLAVNKKLTSASENLSYPTGIPDAVSAAMALTAAEAQEDGNIKSFLLAYISFLSFLAVLFVFVCSPD